MSRSFRVVAALAVLTLPLVVQAQAAAPKTVTFGVSGGLSLPMGDLGDAVEAGFVVAGHAYYKPKSMPSLRFRGDVSFDRWSAKSVSGRNVDASTRSLGFVGNALYDVSSAQASTVKPYLLGGVGLFNTSSSVTVVGTNVSASSTDVGVQVGGGLTFQLSGFSTFLEAKYVNVFSDGGANWIPISFGVRF